MKKALSPRWRSLYDRWKCPSGATPNRVRRASRRGVEVLEGRALLATITEFPIPSGAGSANQIVQGPDGNLWFTENDPVNNNIGKITPSGQITEYKIPTSGANPFGITVGPNGNLWFTEEFGDKIGEITPSGTITEFPVGTSGEFPEGITMGPDGNLWFTENLGHSIAKMTPSGTVTQYPLPTLSSPVGIISGPNGNLWFTDKGAADAVGEITTSGTITEFKLPSIIADPTGIVLSPDKKSVWVTEDFEGHVANVSSAGSVINDFTVPGNFPQPNGITVGPDGNLWIALQGGKQIDEFPVGSAQFTSYTISGSNPQPVGITSGPNNTLWFTDQGNKSIGVITIGAASPTPTPTPTPTTPTPTTPTPTPTTPTPTPTTTPTPTPTTIPVTAALSPASDTGASSSDGITNDNVPSFNGTAPAGGTVTVIATPTSGLGIGVVLGQTTVTSSGTWSVTPTVPLADGSYTISALVAPTSGTTSNIQILPSATEGPLVVDTTGPTIGNASVNPPLGQIALTFQASNAGLNSQQLLNPATYLVTGPSGRRPAHLAVTTFTGGATGTTNVVLTLNGGHALRSGRYTVRILASALTDVAGNPLNGSFYFGFPTGAGTKVGDFLMSFQTDGISATTPSLPGYVVSGDARYLALLRKHLRNEPV
jgi:streptogramin lyase